MLTNCGTRVMILRSQQGLTASQIADLLGYHPATVRWIHRYQRHGSSALADRPRSGRPRLGSPRLARRILRLLDQPAPGPSAGSGMLQAAHPARFAPCTGACARSPTGAGPGWSPKAPRP
jgi:hypothetical protein